MSVTAAFQFDRLLAEPGWVVSLTGLWQRSLQHIRNDFPRIEIFLREIPSELTLMLVID